MAQAKSPSRDLFALSMDGEEADTVRLAGARGYSMMENLRRSISHDRRRYVWRYKYYHGIP